MIGWLTRSTQTNPREAFPIENLPIETFGGRETSAVRLMYRKTPALPAPGTGAAAVRNGIDKNKEDFFRRILPILDSFDAIFNYAKTSDLDGNETVKNWVNTLETLHRRLFSALEKEGLVAIESVGQKLDLSMHEVLDVRRDTDKPDKTIVEEVLRGYRFGNRILRDAKVIVARNQPTTSEE